MFRLPTIGNFAPVGLNENWDGKADERDRRYMQGLPMFPDDEGQAAVQLPAIGDPVHPGQTATQKYGQLPQIEPAVQAPAPALPEIPAAVPSIVDRAQGITNYEPTPEQVAKQGRNYVPDEVTAANTETAETGEAPANTNTATANLPAIDPADAELKAKVDELNEATVRHRDPNKKHSKWSRVAAAIMGWAQGGLMGGIEAARNPHYFEDMRVERERARILPQIAVMQKVRDANLEAERTKAGIEATKMKPIIERERLASRVQIEKQKFENRTKILEIQAKNDGGKWKPYVDEQGRRWKQFQNDPSKEMEPILDPTTGDQDIDPNFKLYSYVDQATGTEVQLTGRVLSDRGVRQQEFNARQTQDAAKFNASQNLEAVKANVTNQFNYSKALYDRMVDMAKSNAEAQGAMVAAQGLLGQMQNAATQMQAIDPAVDEKGYAAAKKTFDDAEEKFYQSVAKTQAGASLVEQLNSQGIQRPGIVEFKPIKATTLKPGVPSSKVSEDVFRQRLVANGVTDPAMQKALISKARTDGVIK